MKYVKLSALIAGLSIATFSVPQVKALVLTDLLNRKLPVSSTSLQKKSQPKPTISSSVSSKPSSSNLIAEAVSRENKIKLVNDTQSEAKPETIAEEKGKLKIVNNTPFMAIVQLYKPDTNQPNNYTYIPPCSTRSLLNTYSDKWEVSFNNQNKQPIGDVSYKKGNTFNVVTSHLNQDQNTKLTCQYENLAKPIFESPPDKKTIADLNLAFTNLLKLIALNGVEEGVGDNQAKVFEIVQKAISLTLQSLPSEIYNLSTEDRNFVIRLLADAEFKNPDAVTPTELSQINQKLERKNIPIQFDSPEQLQLPKKYAKLTVNCKLKILEVIPQGTRLIFDHVVKPINETVIKEFSEDFRKIKRV